MTKKISVHIIFREDKIATIEETSGFEGNNVEKHLAIIGALENAKQNHIKKLNTVLQKSRDFSGGTIEDDKEED